MPLFSIVPLSKTITTKPNEIEASQKEKKALPIAALWTSIRAEDDDWAIPKFAAYNAASLIPRIVERNTADSSNLSFALRIAVTRPIVTKVATNILSKLDGSDQFAIREISKRARDRTSVRIEAEFIGISDVALPAQAGSIAEIVMKMPNEI